jgi:hypothetical protein
MGCRSVSKRPEGCHAFAAYPTASQKLQLRVHNDEGGMHPGIGPVREEIRCAAIFADVTAAIAECHSVFSLCLFAKHAERMRPGIAEINCSRLKYQYSCARLRLREREPPPRTAHRDHCCLTAP